MIRRCYAELLTFPTINERYEYLKLKGYVGKETFGYDRVFNQKFYTSKEWQDIRKEVIIRDNAYDLAVDGYNIYGKIMVHHMNPITLEDIKSENWDYLLNPEFLITTSYDTHQAIHYGNSNGLMKDPIVRTPNDTCPWR